MTEQQEKNKMLIEHFPYLQPRNVWTDKICDDYDYSYVRGLSELPEGWNRLFLLYCKNIKPYLVENGYLDKFRFSQIKEKYGTMRLYNFGIPKFAAFLEYVYERLSGYVCCICGKEATVESQGWICPWCDDCSKTNNVDAYNPISKNFTVKVELYQSGSSTVVEYNCIPYWEEYLKCMQMSEREFLDYICNS